MSADDEAIDILFDAFIDASLDLAEGLAGRACIGNSDRYGVCEDCGKILLGIHDPGGCNPFANVAWHVLRAVRCAHGRARYHLGRIRPIDAGLTPPTDRTGA